MASEATKLLALGKNIQLARKNKGYSQNELAEILNISREHLAKIETAKRCVSLKLLFKIAEALETTEHVLLLFENKL